MCEFQDDLSKEGTFRLRSEVEIIQAMREGKAFREDGRACEKPRGLRTERRPVELELST